MNDLKNCKYCGGEPIQYTHEELNYIGENGFKSTVRCSMCRRSVEAWSKCYVDAAEKAKRYWNEG